MNSNNKYYLEGNVTVHPPVPTISRVDLVIGSGMIVLLIFMFFGFITTCCFFVLCLCRRKHVRQMDAFYNYSMWYREQRPERRDPEQRQQTQLIQVRRGRRGRDVGTYGALRSPVDCVTTVKIQHEPRTHLFDNPTYDEQIFPHRKITI